jgi:uncharacterized membrane protein required for colicin V production
MPEEQATAEPPPISLAPIVWVFLLTLGGGWSWRALQTGDVVLATAIGLLLLVAIHGYLAGFARRAASTISFIAAIALGPVLGTQLEPIFADRLGISGLVSRVACVGTAGILLLVLGTIVLNSVCHRILKRRPRLTAWNRWLGSGISTIQGIAVLLLLLAGVQIIEPNMQRMGADERPGSKYLKQTVRQIAKRTRESALGPLVEKYDPFERIPKLKSLVDRQQQAQLLKDPQQLNRLLNHPSMKTFQESPEFKRSMTKLKSDQDIRELLESKRGMNGSLAVKLMNHPALLELLQQPEFAEAASQFVKTSN